MSDWDEYMYDDEEEEEELSFEDDDDDNDDDDSSNIANDNDNFSESDKAKGGSGTLNGSHLNFNFESVYYSAKSLKEDENYASAIELFNSIIDKTELSSQYQFKAIKQLIKIYETEKDYGQIKSMVLRLCNMKDDPNLDCYYFTSSLLKIVNRIDHTNHNTQFGFDVFQQLLQFIVKLPPTEMTSSYIKLKIKLELCIAYYYIFKKEEKLAHRLLSNLETEIGYSTDSIKNNYILEVIALQILLLLNENMNLKELRRLTTLANTLISGIPQTKILGVINEGSGLVDMYCNNYKQANLHFQDAFKNFNDSGDGRRIDVLIKFIISSILSKSEVNPFQSNDFHGFVRIEKIKLLMELHDSFQCLNLAKYNSLIKSVPFLHLCNTHTFIKEFLPSITELICSEFICQQIPLFTKVKFEYFTEKLEISKPMFKTILLKLYNRGLISNCRIDYINDCIIQATPEKFVDIAAVKIIENAMQFYNIYNKSTLDRFTTQCKLLPLKSSSNQQQQQQQQRQQQYIQVAKNGTETFLLNQLNVDANARNEYFKMYDGQENAPADVNPMLVENINHKSDIFIGKPSFTQDIDELKDELVFGVGNLRIVSSFLKKDGIIGTDLTKDLQNHLKLFNYIDAYIGILSNSEPVKTSRNVSYLNKVKGTQIINEYNKLFSHEGSTQSTEFCKDPNIPDIIQQTTMNDLEPPSNPDSVNIEECLLHGQSKKIAKLRVIKESTNIISKKYQENQLRTSSLSFFGNNSESGNLRMKKRSTELSRLFLNRFSTKHSIPNDQSETTSLDNMSVDDRDEKSERDVF